MSCSYIKKNKADSKLIYNGDPGDAAGAVGATEKKYQMNSYDPATEVTRFSYTSGRVAKRVYNRYAPNEHKVVGYYTDWSQYDGRYETSPNAFDDNQCGRGIDLMKLDPFAYDRLIIGFAGIVGDNGEKKATIDRAAIDLQRKPDEATFVDAWGDVASYRNCGFQGWVSNDYMALFSQSKAQGVLGGLRLLKEKNPYLALSFSIGGWTMSEAFYSMARDEARRATFVDSVAHLIDLFPMFTEVDIDWEYPGMPGNNNQYAPDDAVYFAQLIRDLKQKLPAIKVSIAVSANPQGLRLADIPKMIEAGVEGINLMTYDFFGTPWAPALAHHSNLYTLDAADEASFSVDKAVNILLDAGIEPHNILIGYVGYSRNARSAAITQFSPLAGTYTPGTGSTTGSFESGTTEWYDLIYNYLDLENQQGRNGFDVYTDLSADADYLFNKETGLFLSYDSPRAVKAKGEYVREKKLGGMLTWTVDHDNGVLVNAAREGMGNELIQQVIDMSPFYFYGKNIEGEMPKAVIDGPLQAKPGQEVTFSAEKSAGSALSYTWSAPGLAFLEGQTAMAVSGTLPDDEQSYTISLQVTDDKQRSDNAVQALVVSSQEAGIPVAKAIIALSSGTAFTLSAERSTDPQGQALSYLWQAEGLPFDGAVEQSVSASVPVVTLATDYAISLTVSNGQNSDATQVELYAIPRLTGNIKANITGKNQVAGGDRIALSASGSTGAQPLTYLWTAPGLSFDGATSQEVQATAPDSPLEAVFIVKLTVTDANGLADSETLAIKVVPATDIGTWEPKPYSRGAEVTHNYQGQGMHNYQAKWHAEPTEEPGNPACTSSQATGDNKVWHDLGAL